MPTFYRNTVIKKITEMPEEQISKVLIFMAGMEAEHHIREQKNMEPSMEPVRKAPGQIV